MRFLFILLAAGRVLGQAPVEAERLLEQGLEHFRAGRTAEARPLLERSVTLAPANARAWKMLGLVSTAGGDVERAAAVLGKACELDAKDEEACYYLGRNLYALGRYDAARAAFEKALFAAPASGRVHRAAALNFAALDMSVDAERHFLNAVRLHDGGGEDARIDYGAFLFRQGRMQEAVGPLQQAVRASPSSARANLELGRVWLHSNKLADAVACLKKAVAIEPANSGAHLLLGRAYLQLGKTEEGEREMEMGRRGWASKR